MIGAELELEALSGPEQRGQHHARVVDQQIEPIVRCRKAMGEGRHGVEIGEIQDVGCGRSGRLLGSNPLGRGAALVRISAREHHVRAASRQLARDLQADAGVGPGDNGRVRRLW
jgi:hypothetical protein